MFLKDLPSDDDLRKLYVDSQYYEMDSFSQRRVDLENARRFNIAKRYVSGGRVLDIGCATGRFLDLAKQNGFETFGVEISPNNSRVAIDNGHNVFVGNLTEYLRQNASSRFDLIACLDVIEHVPVPIEFLARISTLLKPNAILMLSTPNYSGVVAKLLGKCDPFLIPPEHLNFFTYKGLAKMLCKSGLKVVRTETFGTLTQSEMERGIVKHLPKILLAMPSLSFPAIRLGFKGLNWMKLGLECEYYAMPDLNNET
jgi:2-polyprenyl-3-methyl-5-hydroxy-6-metoxy-1,4-benzoquinol methylase